MAIFFLDPENGNDAADGLSFANRWKTFTSGATSGRVAAGDTIRVIKSPDAVNTGINASWTALASGAMPTFSSGNVTAATNASPIVITQTGHGHVTNDYVGISGDTGNTAANGIWKVTVIDANTYSLNGSTGNGTSAGTRTAVRQTSAIIELASAVTKTVALTIASGTNSKPNWTASANVTSSIVTSGGGLYATQSDNWLSLIVAAGFTTGKAAYYTLPSALDLSGYQQLSFYLACSTVNMDISIKLCSDTTGDVPVNTFTISSATANSGYYGLITQWHTITKDNGANLGSNINSIAVYVNTDNGAQTIWLNHIIACLDKSNASCITLNSLLGKGGTNPKWYPVQQIMGTVVKLLSSISTNCSTTAVAYDETTETAALWRLTPIFVNSQTAGTCATVGTVSNRVAVSGGWNSTDMTTQTGETTYASRVIANTGIDLNAFYSLSKINFVGFNVGVFLKYSDIIVSSSFAVGNSTAFNVNYTSSDSSGAIINTDYVINNNNSILFGSGGGVTPTKKTLEINPYNTTNVNISSYGILGISGSGLCVVNKAIIKNSLKPALAGTNANFIVNASTINNVGDNTSSYAMDVGSNSNVFTFNSCTINLDSSHRLKLSGAIILNDTELNSSAIFYNTSYNYQMVYYTRSAAGSGQYCQQYAIVTDSTTRHTPSGVSWKVSPLSAVMTPQNPVRLPIGMIGVTAGTTVTAKIWVYRDNTGINAALVCDAYALPGITTKQSASAAGAASTWEQLTITFTPSVAGAVPLFVEVYGGTTYNVWVDDLTVTQP